MACPELDRLREDIAALRAQLRDKSLAREQAQNAKGRSAHGDFEGYLKRRIERAAQEIESHIREHNCQES